MAYYAAAAYDAVHASPDEVHRAENQSIYEFLVPVVKGFSTEMSIEVASLGVQVHGGMGFIEETGAAQYYRDARILTIYEGTTAIQANDLIGRKTVRDGGAIAKVLIERILQTEKDLAASNTANAQAVLRQLTDARKALEDSVEFILANIKTNIKDVFAGSVAYLRLCGLVFGGWQMARALLVAERLSQQDPSFYEAKINTARFFAENLLPQAQALATSLIEGGYSCNALTAEQF